MDVEPIAVRAPRPVERVVFSQRWTEVTFVHWAVDPRRLAPYMPAGVRPDIIAGRSYVGFVPFVMRDIGILGGPAVPYFGSFYETNVRLYSVDEGGRRGVVFVSLDASRLVPVVVARWGPRLPYLWSHMTRTRRGDRIAYTCRRRWPGPRGARSRILIDVGRSIEAGPLEHFLTARWGLHNARRGGGTVFWPNDHDQWALRDATVRRLDDELLAACGFGDLQEREPDSVLFSDGVDVVFGPREPLRPRATGA